MAPPYSVTSKTQLAPSGIKNDYASYSRYWWPDSTTSDGLPYIRKDGETNPDSQDPKKSDRPRIGQFAQASETLGLAYYFTGELKYAEKAAALIRTWFLNPDTKMNTHLNHAQCRPGHNLGSKSGVLDGRLLIQAFEASLLIETSNTLNASEYLDLKNWANAYYNWLTQNELALQEARSKNNHGSYYDVQIMYLAIYSDQLEDAKNIAEQFYNSRLQNQIKPDGSMPEEAARTRPLFYSIYNLHAMCLVAHFAEQVDVDIWESENKNGRLKKAIDYLLPYVDSDKNWPSPTIKKTDRMALYPIIQSIKDRYPDIDFDNYLQQFPIDPCKSHRATLAYPLMR